MSLMKFHPAILILFLCLCINTKRAFALTLEEANQKISQIQGLNLLLNNDDLTQLTSDPTMLYYPKVLDEALTLTLQSEIKNTTTFKASLRKVLEGKVPTRTIPSRLASLTGKYTYATLLRALGDMTLSEVNELTYGSDIENPSEDSLLGKYMKETGAKITTRKFSLSEDLNNPGTPQGKKRILVPINQLTIPAFLKYFAREDMMTSSGHAILNHNGKSYSHGNPGNDFFIRSYEDHILILLTTTEGQRMSQYFQLFHYPYWSPNAFTDRNFIGMYPWALQGYSAKSGYDVNCTQWIGNIPLGDTLVDAYTFPPNYESGEREPRTQPLRQYESNDPLVKRIWTVPGHQQFADLIGQHEANIRGEFANPGWVAITLVGPTTQERVPIIFVNTNDVTQKLPSNYMPQFERAQ